MAVKAAMEASVVLEMIAAAVMRVAEEEGGMAASS